MSNRNVGIILVIILLVGLVLAVFLLKQKTQVKQEASQIVNINTGAQITSTKNSDGTMGPQSSDKNYSISLSEKELGSLTFSITDPVQGDSVFPTHIPTVTQGASVQEGRTSTPSPSNIGIQKVKSLILKIRKIEVHLAQTKNPSQKVDKWETFNMQLPISVDLVQLVNGDIVNLTSTKLVAGTYTEVRLYVESSTVVLENDKIITLKISGKDGIVRVVQDFVINQGKNTNLIMDFDAQHSVFYDGKDYLFKPDVSKLLVTN